MGAGASTTTPLPYSTVEDALADGKTQEEVDAYIKAQELNSTTQDQAKQFHELNQLIDPWSDIEIKDQLAILLSNDEDTNSNATRLKQIIVDASGSMEQSLLEVESSFTCNTKDATPTGVTALSIIMDESTATDPPKSFSFFFLSHVVSLSFAQGGLTSWCLPDKEEKEEKDKKENNFIKYLNLSGCPLNSSPYFSSFNLSNLLILDLSFADIPSLGVLNFKQLANLRRLALESCSLESLQCNDKNDTSPLVELKKLEYLNISDNELADIESVQFGLKCVASTLLELDARDNEIQDTLGRNKYNTFMTVTIFNIENGAPLIKLDNRMLNRTGNKLIKTKMLSQTEGISESIGGNDEVVNANEDRGSCSCLAGNACVEQYNCKDWKNRFKIAKEVRKMKGMEEIPGLG
jgi:Leucine-rich repeat (LRR) protein